MAQFLYRLGRLSFLHRRLALAIWVGVLVASSLAAATLSGPTSTSFSIPGTPAQEAIDKLQAHFPAADAAGASARVVSQDVLTRTFPNARALESHRARGFELMLQVISRAQAEGSLRRDLVPEDMVLLLMANAGVVQGAGHDAPDAWRRFVALMLDAFRADGAQPLPEPPSPRQVMRAMHRLTPSRPGHPSTS